MKHVWQWVTVLSMCGILLALYLLWQQFFHPAFQPCNITQTITCEAIISGSVSKTVGIPTPLIGFVGYLFMLTASLLKKRKLLVGMASFGLVFCAWIAYQELFMLHVICPVCILCQVTMLTVFVLSLILLRRR